MRGRAGAAASEHIESSVVYPLLRLNLLPVGVFDFEDLGHGVGPGDNLRMGVPAGQDQMQVRRLEVDKFQHLGEIDEPELEGVIDLVKDQEIERAGKEFFLRQDDGIKGITPMLGMRIRVSLDAAEPFARQMMLHTGQ